MHSTSSLLQNGLLLVGLVTLAIVGVVIIGRFRREATGVSLPSRAELLEDFRRAYEKGEISQEEYLRIQEKLSRRGKKASAPWPDVPGAKGAAQEPAPEPPERTEGPSPESSASNHGP